MANSDHALPALADRQDLDEHIRGGSRRVKRNDVALSQRKAMIRAQGLAAGIDHGKFLDRHDVERRGTQGLVLNRTAAVNPAIAEVDQARDDPPDAALGEGYSAPGGDLDLCSPLPLDMMFHEILQGQDRRTGPGN